MGGPVAAAAHNPKSSIGESIEAVARACAPEGAQVRVRVDRFTEFTALIELPRPAAQPALAELARCILSQGSDYFYRLQFSYRGGLLAELDRQAIEAVANWERVSVAEVQRLWSNSGEGQSAVAQAGDGRNLDPNADKEEDQNLTMESRVQNQALATFRASLERAQNFFKSAQESYRHAVEPGDLLRVADVGAKRVLLKQAEAQAAQARVVLEDPAAEYRRIMDAAHLDEVYARAAARSMASRYDRSRAAAAEMFNRFSAHLRASGRLLDALGRNLGEWGYDPTTKVFGFQSAAAHADIKPALAESEASIQSLNSAIEQWQQLVSQP